MPPVSTILPNPSINSTTSVDFSPKESSNLYILTSLSRTSAVSMPEVAACSWMKDMGESAKGSDVLRSEAGSTPRVAAAAQIWGTGTANSPCGSPDGEGASAFPTTLPLLSTARKLVWRLVVRRRVFVDVRTSELTFGDDGLGRESVQTSE
ncbi:uncharacterized protein STEHIDRAFT_113170 [Stereum hirsutum FP-91666 SS1]|uniref:uncharacterized protein n=1 Tax=Stereum hirsutum (strain FP-91666) TaxID=721885 RepID=UPI0004449D24|nr:uncharacterized protein STEHIDRAFT_113170 [Stereum hirsutum FP-91666 SS1]EIM83941.1 hypothetical protein STEHIDRAFT_113170 [Stereum hirsutum FP-91666 SS1]